MKKNKSVPKNEGWIRFKDVKPETDIIALVSNEKGWMYGVKACYDSVHDVWILHDPHYFISLVLDITHYLPIPDLKTRP